MQEGYGGVSATALVAACLVFIVQSTVGLKGQTHSTYKHLVIWSETLTCGDREDLVTCNMQSYISIA